MNRALFIGFLLALGVFVCSLGGCYATTTPTLSCAADPTQDGCLPPIHDQRVDGGSQ